MEQRPTDSASALSNSNLRIRMSIQHTRSMVNERGRELEGAACAEIIGRLVFGIDWAVVASTFYVFLRTKNTLVHFDRSFSATLCRLFAHVGNTLQIPPDTHTHIRYTCLQQKHSTQQISSFTPYKHIHTHTRKCSISMD